MATYNIVYPDGWVELRDTYLLGVYWLDGFPVIQDEEERATHGRGPDKRRSPILDYQDGGIGSIQWVNATHDKAAVLHCDGGWKDGGTWHLWVSPGARTLPYEVEWTHAPTIVAGDHSGWQDSKDEAADMARSYLGLAPDGGSNH